MNLRDALARRLLGRSDVRPDSGATRRARSLCRTWAAASLAVLFCAVLTAPAGKCMQARADEPPAAPAATPAPTTAAERTKRPDRFEIRASDGSILKVTLLDAKIPLKTEYGTLAIPLAQIRRIDFASRLPELVAERITAAVARLGDNEFAARDAASAELLELKEAAYPALLVAAKHDDPEVARRAELLLEEIRETVEEDNLQHRDDDLIHTDKSQIAGTIEMESLEVETALLGRQQLRLDLLRRLLAAGEVEEDVDEVLPDPGTLVQYKDQVGKTFRFRVSAPPPGGQGGGVWGSDIYTFDSNLAMAAVHAGVLAQGQTKAIGVTMVGPQNAFAGSTRNGLTSGAWGAYPSAFTFSTGKNARPAARIRLR